MLFMPPAYMSPQLPRHTRAASPLVGFALPGLAEPDDACVQVNAGPRQV